MLLFIYHLFPPQCFHLSAPEADGGVLIGCFPPGFFLVLWKARKPSTLAQPTNPPTHIERAPLDPLCSPGRAGLPRSGARTPSCGRQPLAEWQPSLIQRRDLNLASKQHLLSKHARGASTGNFSPFLSIRLKGTPPNYDCCLLCLSGSQASGKCVCGEAQGKTCQALIHFFH